MCKSVQRGYVPGDPTEFGAAAVPELHRAAQNLYYLLNQGYPIKGASVFVGNHYLLSERQQTLHILHKQSDIAFYLAEYA